MTKRELCAEQAGMVRRLRWRLVGGACLLALLTVGCSPGSIDEGVYLADEGGDLARLEFKVDTWVYQSGSRSEVAGSYTVEDDQITVFDDGLCPDIGEGTYVWTVDGDTLSFTVYAVSIRSGDNVLARFPADTCAERLAIFDGRIYRLHAPNPESG